MTDETFSKVSYIIAVGSNALVLARFEKNKCWVF